MARKSRNDIDYVVKRGLVETRDAEIDRPILRKPGFAGMPSFGDMEDCLSREMRAKRAERKLTREQLAAMIGLSTQVFGRYEKAISKMHVTRLIHICEVLDASPVDMIFQAAPHLFGKSDEEARTRAEALSAIQSLPKNLLVLLLPLLNELRSRTSQFPGVAIAAPTADLAARLAELDKVTATEAIMTALRETLAGRQKPILSTGGDNTPEMARRRKQTRAKKAPDHESRP
ncbi:helix-turn-helix transcriptional regulator [Mesorhizobium carmichaelinearum]|uniref:helix-turn-helix transcriptional regulator n=1 Tax=Mesorhizobium carmichaelinearum TaxID=1208188 RepID=UPI000BA4777F|nr:helix-turn-helix transcriptional regulator [Mesorhizobium carmichaelinearum]